MNNMVKFYSTKDRHQKEKVQKYFIDYKIPYRLKVKNNLQINIADTAVIGNMGNNKINLTYVFYVRKKDVKKAIWLISEKSS